METEAPENESLQLNNDAERSEIIEHQSAVIANSLMGVEKEDYGEHYNTHLLEQYKKYLEMADKISDRRSAANTFFLTINTGLISALGLAKLASENTFDFLFITGSVAAILLCYSWYRLIRAYQDLNTAKFKVVHEIENNLPIKPYDAEWEAVERGENKKLYFPFTHIERRIPWIFILLYVGIIFFQFTVNRTAIINRRKTVCNVLRYLESKCVKVSNHPEQCFFCFNINATSFQPFKRSCLIHCI